MALRRTLVVDTLWVAACGGVGSGELTGEDLAIDARRMETAADIAPTLHGIWGT